MGPDIDAVLWWAVPAGMVSEQTSVALCDATPPAAAVTAGAAAMTRGSAPAARSREGPAAPPPRYNRRA